MNRVCCGDANATLPNLHFRIFCAAACRRRQTQGSEMDG